MSIKSRLQTLERRRRPRWEAPLFIIMDDDDVPRVEALYDRYREEILRDLARGRQLTGVDFR